jgi:2-polyprenyl-3-methyl-5-hydroxy-6-metoxy-1,4-benzoquinol methylase
MLNIYSKVKNRVSRFLSKSSNFKTEEEFYTYLFTKNPSWSSPFPNEDETIRWNEIEKVLNNLNLATSSDILEIGSGRGWLSQKLSKYGNVIGIEPVEPVVKYAKKLFPNLEFYAEYPATFLEKFPTKKFNIIVSSEVLEHVTDKDTFMKQIQSLLNSNGVVIITTPRLECYNDFIKVYGNEPNQPIEEWLSETQVKELLISSNFDIIGKSSFANLPIEDQTIFRTQLWVFKKQ